jgi:sulfur-carrier protein
VVSVFLASALRSVSHGEGQVDLEDFEGDLAALLLRLEEHWGPNVRARLLDGGEVRRFVNVYIDGHDARFLGGLKAPVPRGATVDLIPAVAGG